MRPFGLPHLPYIGHIPAALLIGPRSLLAFSGDDLRIGAAITGRFYAEGLVWALSLPVHELLRWNRLMRRVVDTEEQRR